IARASRRDAGATTWGPNYGGAVGGCEGPPGRPGVQPRRIQPRILRRIGRLRAVSGAGRRATAGDTVSARGVSAICARARAALEVCRARALIRPRLDVVRNPRTLERCPRFNRVERGGGESEIGRYCRTSTTTANLDTLGAVAADDHLFD